MGPRKCISKGEKKLEAEPGCCNECEDRTDARFKAVVADEEARWPGYSQKYWDGYIAGYMKGYMDRIEDAYQLARIPK